jgi:hypothetical protein
MRNLVLRHNYIKYQCSGQFQIIEKIFEDDWNGII